MSRNRSGQKKKKKVPGSAIHVAYELENELQLFPKTIKCINMSDTTSMIDENQSICKESKDPESDDEPKTCDSSVSCNCRNCQSLQNLTKCGVCFDTLQNSQIKSCSLCCNVVCVRCASRLTKCPFCRSILPLKRNQAFERLVNQLALPCKNSKFGCEILLDGENRSIHESICNFSTVTCPLNHGRCGWQGTVAKFPSHLQQVHELETLRESGLTVEIHSHQNTEVMEKPVYTICLACHNQLFLVRMLHYQNRLRLSFIRLGYETSQPNTTRPPRYGVLVTIQAHAGQRFQNLIPFDKYNHEIREITITYDNFYPAPEQPPPCPYRRGRSAKLRKDDLVEVKLLIKELKEE